jgi:hypothetical protein
MSAIHNKPIAHQQYRNHRSRRHRERPDLIFRRRDFIDDRHEHDQGNVNPAVLVSADLYLADPPRLTKAAIAATTRSAKSANIKMPSTATAGLIGKVGSTATLIRSTAQKPAKNRHP